MPLVGVGGVFMSEKIEQNINRITGNGVGQGFISVVGFGRVESDHLEEFTV